MPISPLAMRRCCIRREAVEELLRKPELPNSESKFLFYLLSAKMFLEEWAA